MKTQKVLKVYPFKTKLLKLAAWIFFVIGVFAVVSVYVIYRVQKWDSQSRTSSYLSRNLEQQINRLIPTFLLEEQWAGTELILERIKAEENLSDIQIVPYLSDIPEKFSTCTLGEENKTCLIFSEDEIGFVAPIRESSMEFGYLLKCKLRDEVFTAGNFLHLTYAIFIVLGVALLTFTIVIMRFLNREAKLFLRSITRWLDRALDGKSKGVDRPTFSIQEANELALQISDLIGEHEDSRRKAIVADIARQVAHDIRSPLAALEMSLQDLKALPEERRLLIKSACEEIRDIVNVLRETKASEVIEPSIASDMIKVELLAPILSTLVSEKRMQYKNKTDLMVTLKIDPLDWGAFAKIHRTDFKRVISNLVNNSVEAFGKEAGHIQIRLGTKDSHVYVEVADDGCGIPRDRLDEVLKQGTSFGKANGTGLGLYHAQQCVKGWSGRLTVESEEGDGTKVRMILPRTPAPNWFAPEILLHKDKKVVILDDDPSIHLIWKSRLGPLMDEELLSSVFHFHTGAALLEWWEGVPSEMASQILFLFDFELIDEHMTGLQLIKKIGLYNQCILVTSHYEEEQLQKECMRLGARMISKTMAGFIPLKSLERGDVERFVLIDDSKVTRLSWRVKAKERSLPFEDFDSVEAFQKMKAKIPKTAAIYIDSNLGGGQRGEEFAVKLHGEGYRNLFLATGHSSKDFESLSFLKGVVGKDPPWL